MTPPNPLAFNVQGIQTRPHDDQRRAGYLVRVKALNVWMPVEQALQIGMVSMPPALPSATPTQPLDRAEVETRIRQLLNRKHTP